MKKQILTLLLLLLGCLTQAQVYPVQVIPQVIPPYSLKLSDYTTSFRERIVVTLLMTDINEANRQIRLKMYIEGQGINIQSTQYITGAQPIFLDGGVPQRLSNIDLSPYFRLENLQGMTPEQYGQPLPEGFYRICFEAFDWITGQKLSLKSCVPVFWQLNDPPWLNLPQRGDVITARDPQNIIFQWTPRHINASNVQYEFTLVEIWDPYIDPQAAFIASRPMYQTTTYANTLLFGPAEPQLLYGKRYAWRVRAFSSTAAEENAVFRNNGYSEIYYFDYLMDCPMPTFLLSEATGSSSVKITWQNTPEQNRFNVQYRKKNVENARWFNAETYNTETTLYDLEPGTAYEFRVGGLCSNAFGGLQNESYSYSRIQNFSTPEEEETAYYNCGINPDIQIANQNPLQNLGVGETFTAGDFPVHILEVSGSGGSFSGTGWVRAPYLGKMKIKVTFNNARINTDYQLTAGEVVTTYDPNWSGIMDVDNVIGEITNVVEDALGIDQEDIIEEEFPSVIHTIEKMDNGNIRVVDASGYEKIYPGGRDMRITDAQGNVYSVDEDGTITKEEKAEGGAATTSNTEGLDKNGKVTAITAKGIKVIFTNASGAKYAYDILNENTETAEQALYERVKTPDGDNYDIPYKAVVKGETDRVLAAVVISGTSVSADSLIFKTTGGSAIRSEKQGENFILTVEGKFDGAETVLATLKDTTETQKIAGAFKLVHVKPMKVNLTVVPLNTDAPSGIQEKLDAIFNPVGIQIDLSVAERFDISTDLLGADGKLETGESGFAANYTGEQKAIINAYKENTGISSDTYYIFYTGLAPSQDEIGFMPLSRRYGFVFSGGTARTIAHELAHGAFKLEHPWSDNKVNIPKEKTSGWLMDYLQQTKLPHHHWRRINDPALRLYAFQDEEEGEMIASIDTSKICISILELNTQFAPGAGTLKLKYVLSNSTSTLMDKYPNEKFNIHFSVADKEGNFIYHEEFKARQSDEIVWDGYLNNDKSDSLVFEKGPFKLVVSITAGENKDWFSTWQDFKDNLYEVFNSDSINTFTKSIDTTFNIINDPVQLDWIANKGGIPMAIKSIENYKTFVDNWKKRGFFTNDEAKPLEWLKNHGVTTISVNFVNATVSNIIKELGMVINAADSILRADSPTLYSTIGTKYMGNHSGLCIRYISNSTSPSNHSIGAAIDFRVPQNPMYTSRNKKHAGFIKYITGVDVLKSKTAEAVTTAHKTFMEKFHGKNYGNINEKHNEILDKYILIYNYDKIDKIKLSNIEKITDNDIVIDDFLSNRQKLITTLETHKSIIVFNETSKSGIDKLISHINTISSDTIPKLTDADIQAFFDERNEFYDEIVNIGFTDLVDFYIYFNTNKPFGNLLFEHGFCDIELEVYNAFNKAHIIVSRKLIDKELKVEWGGIYNSLIDGMHFSLDKELIIKLTNKK